MSRVSSLVKRHPVTTFFVLAYALSWWAWIPYALGVFPNPVASFGPFLAALVVLALTEGKAGLLGLFRRMIRWRVAPGWYAVALLLPAVLTAVAAMLNVMLGAHAPSPAQLSAWPGILSTLQSSFSFQASAAYGRSPAGGVTQFLGCSTAGRHSLPA